MKRERDAKERKEAKAEHRRAKAAALAAGTLNVERKKPAPEGPVAFLFPGQGSQAVGMLNVRWRLTKGGGGLGEAVQMPRELGRGCANTAGTWEWWCKYLAVPARVGGCSAF